MKGMIPRDKMSKKQRRELDSQKRTLWAFCPQSRRIESKKRYDRKKAVPARYDDTGRNGFLFAMPSPAQVARRTSALA